jgi:hypothetical protein
MTDSEREDRLRRRTAVQREMTRLRSTDDPEETEDTEDTDEHDLVDAVDEEHRRERDVQNDDRAS